MDLNYNIEKVEKIIENLLRSVLEKKGNKGVSHIIDDILNERPLDVSQDIKQELENYSTDTLRLIVEKQILLSLENGALANRKSYWDVLKTRAPRIKQGIMAHYYDNYINFLKQDNPATYQARTITELKETYNKVIGENLSVINDMGNAVIGNVSSIDIENNKTIKINNEVRGKLSLSKEINNGKFVNRDEFIHLIDTLDDLPNSKQLITDNPNISLNDLKIVTKELSHTLNVETNENNKEVTLGEAGIQSVGEIDNESTLPDGTYVSLEELSFAINKYINRPKEEEKPLKVTSIKQKIKKKIALITMSVTLLTAALPALKKNVEENVPKVVSQIDNSLQEANITMVTEQMNNAFSGMTNAIEGVSEKASELKDATMEMISQTQEIQEEVPTQVVEPISEDVTPITETNLDENVSSENEEGVTEENVAVEVEENIVNKPIENEEESISEVTEPVQEVVETADTEEMVESINEDQPTEEKLATSNDFSFKFDESNEIAAAARNRGFTDDQIKKAVAISRQETGNYTSSAFLNKHNYGGMMTKDYEPMTFETKEEGLDRFLTMLQDKYFGKGLNTLEQIGNVYDPQNPAWPGKVQATLENGGLEKVEEVTNDVTIDEESKVEETTEPVQEESRNAIDINEENILDKVSTEVSEEMKVDTTENKQETEVKEVTTSVQEEYKDTTDVKEGNTLDKVPTEVLEKMEAVNNAEIKEEVKVAEVVEPIKEEVQKPIEPVKEVQEVPTPVQVVEPIQEQVVQPIEQPIMPEVVEPIVQAVPASDTASILGLTPQQLDVVKATIRHEAGNNPAEMANVASAVKNRMNNSGASAYAVITAPNQFESYGGGHYKQYTNGNYYQGDPATGAQVDAMMDAILTGTMAPTHGYSSFRGKNSPKGVQFEPGGNKYR